MANRAAIEILEKARAEMIAEFERKLTEVDKVIADLRASDGSSSKPANPPTVRPGQYKQYDAPTAARMYLQEAGGGPIPYTEFLLNMKRGECPGDPEKPWTKARYPRNWKIMFQQGKWRDVFDYNEVEDTVALKRGLKLA